MFPQLVFFVICGVLILTGSSWAQHPHLLTSFGPCIERLLDYKPLWVCVSRTSSDPRPMISVVSHVPPYLRFYRMKDNGDIAEAGVCDLPGPQKELAPLEPDGGYIALSEEGNIVTTIRQMGSAFVQHAIPLGVNAQHLVVADINNDGVRDILLFGRTMTGVATLLGKADGSFAMGPLLFPEIPVSDLRTTDLNGDGITDVVLLAWLTNQLMIFNGISHGVFSEQVSINVPGEPGSLALGPVDRLRTLRIAVTLPQEQQVALVTADAAGELIIDGTVDCPGKPLGVDLALINLDPWPDMMVPTDKGVTVLQGSAQGEFGPVSVFGPGSDCSSWSIADLDEDRRADVVFADTERRRLIVLGNAEHAGHTTWPDVYAVGSAPSGVAIGDFDNDGRSDICVVNSASATLSFLLNKGGGRILGQISAFVPDNPSFVTVVPRLQSRIQTLITSHPSTEKLGILSLEEGVSKTELFAIPTGTLPSVIFAREDETSGSLVILVRNSDPSNGAKSMSLFEQLQSGQFLERSLRANLPQSIIALTVDDFYGKKSFDMAFVTNDKGSRLSTVSLADGSPSFWFTHAHPVFSFMDSLSSTRAIFSGRIDDDPYLDLILVAGPPRNAIGIAYGREDGTFRDSIQWIEGVHPTGDESLIVKDVDGDGIKDLIVLDDVEHAIIVLRGSSGGEFSRPRVIASGIGVSGFAVAPLRRTDQLDLVLCHREEGTVEILTGPFGRSGR